MSGIDVVGDGTAFIAGLAAMIFYATATLIGKVGENTFRKTRVDNSEPALSVSAEALRQTA